MVLLYKFKSEDRDYTSWSTMPTTTINIDPISNHLLSGDEFTLSSDTNNISIIHSPIRENRSIPGVLILHGNRTFGRTTNGRLLYQCIPFDKTLPVFLLPYNAKIGFNKLQTNKYIIFSFSNWDGKHPMGIITETIGDVNNYQAYCTYQLWTHDLVHSLTKFTKELNNQLKNTSDNTIIQKMCDDPRFQFEDHTKESNVHNGDYVFTIDPEGSVDLDDGFSISQTSDYIIITIHIANVYACLETLQLWDHMTPRVSTIYLPDDRKTMLPNALSDRICSLLENNKRATFAMEVACNKQTGQIIQGSERFFNAIVNINKNFRYEEPKLLKNKNYKMLFDITKKLGDNNIIDSHDVVSYWMVYMNSISASHLFSHKTGVFRSVIKTSNNTHTHTHDNDTRRVLESWKNTHSSYQLFDESNDLRHMVLNIESYVHITSPIRRLVDILNQICFNQQVFNNEISTDADHFLTSNFKKIDSLNIDVKSIQRVQMDCDMLYSCIHNPDITNTSHEGIVFNQTCITKDTFRYTVYLTNMKRMYSLDTNEPLDNYSTHSFKILLFDTENTGHRKMRLLKGTKVPF